MNVTVDCRMLDSSGIGVYLRGCLPYLIKSGWHLSLLGNKSRLSALTHSENVRIIPCDIKPFSVKELFFFPPETARQINKSDVYYSPFFNIPCKIAIPVYTTIHDIIFADMPEIVSKPGFAARMWFYRRAYRKSKKIFTVSEFSKSRITHHLGGKKPVMVTYTAAQQLFHSFAKNKNTIDKNQTIIFIGNIKKHKGLGCLLDAFRQAKSEGLPHKLIIVGERNNFRTTDNEILQKDQCNDFIEFTGYISDEQLTKYISSASLLVQPSLYEGFCLPPLEALVLGTNVLISDIPVLREIYSGFPVEYFKAGDADDLKRKMLELLQRNIPPPLMPDDLLSKFSFEKTASVIMNELANQEKW